jgi:hypothetical protein
MGKKKSSDPGWLASHLAIQFMAFLLVLICSGRGDQCVHFALANTIIHGIIDWNIWRLYKAYVHAAIRKNPKHPLFTDGTEEPWKYWEDHWFYTTIGFDQLLHTLTIVALAKVFL